MRLPTRKEIRHASYMVFCLSVGMTLAYAIAFPRNWLAFVVTILASPVMFLLTLGMCLGSEDQQSTAEVSSSVKKDKVDLKAILEAAKQVKRPINN